MPAYRGLRILRWRCFRWPPQYTLRTLLIVCMLWAIVLGFWRWRTRERRIVDALVHTHHVHCAYDYQYTDVVVPDGDGLCGWTLPPDAGEFSWSHTPSAPAWARRLLGDDFFGRVVTVDACLNDDFGDDELALACELDRLRVLILTSTAITDEGLSPVARLEDLERLSLRHTLVTDRGLAHLVGLAKLQILALRGTAVTDAGIARLGDLPNLWDADLMDTSVGDETLRKLSRCPRMAYLELDSTEVTDAGVAHLTALRRLRRLNLNNTRITDASVDHLVKLTTLWELYVHKTRITEEGGARLKRALPCCSVWCPDPPTPDNRDEGDANPEE